MALPKTKMTKAAEGDLHAIVVCSFKEAQGASVGQWFKYGQPRRRLRDAAEIRPEVFEMAVEVLSYAVNIKLTGDEEARLQDMVQFYLTDPALRKAFDGQIDEYNREAFPDA